MKPYTSRRDQRFYHADEAIQFVERTNCAKGCAHAVDPTDDMPGGACPVLAAMSLGGGTVVPELTDGGRWIRCEKREAPAVESVPSQVEVLF